MEKKSEECKGGAPEWMTTYGDLVTLLMCFFVLLFAFSEIDAQKFDAVMESFQGSAGILEGGKTLTDSKLVFNAMPETDVSQKPIEIKELEMIKEIIDEYLEMNGLEAEISVELQDRGLIIRFPENALFDSGYADIKTDSEQTLRFLGELFSQPEFMERHIRVEGHTDNVPISTKEFPSNWELSARRATNVVTFFINQMDVDDSKLAIAAYEDNYPVAVNDTAEGRAKNRRVDIVILNNNYTGLQLETTNEVEVDNE